MSTRIEPAARPGKARAVRRMFAGIAPRYDLLNHLLSFNLDHGWRRAAVRALDLKPGERVLDACAGTLDLARLLAQAGARVVAFDFCHEMLLHGRAKTGSSVSLVEADALAPPFPDASFDVATVAFGIRNLEDPRAGLKRLARLLKPGGRLAVLEFARPRNRLFRVLYYAYFHRALPCIGAAISGDAEAYRYLPDSVMQFLEPEEMEATLGEAGMVDVGHRTLGFGAVTLVVGRRP